MSVYEQYTNLNETYFSVRKTIPLFRQCFMATQNPKNLHKTTIVPTTTTTNYILLRLRLQLLLHVYGLFLTNNKKNTNNNKINNNK